MRQSTLGGWIINTAGLDKSGLITSLFLLRPAPIGLGTKSKEGVARNATGSRQNLLWEEVTKIHNAVNRVLLSLAELLQCNARPFVSLSIGQLGKRVAQLSWSGRMGADKKFY